MHSPHYDNNKNCPLAWRVQLGDARWVCENDDSLVTGWQLLFITGIPWQHFTQAGPCSRVSKPDASVSYRRVR